MAILELRIYPDEILREQTQVVSTISTKIFKLLDDMAETMYTSAGIGLAAPQIGSLDRITVIDVSEDGDQLQEFINPFIISSTGKVNSEEGCLSIPEYRDTITRAETVVVEALDRSGNKFQVEADGLLAICLQHEIDHLDGILFIDHLSRLKRDLFTKKYLKTLK